MRPKTRKSAKRWMCSNAADQMVFTTEKALGELGDKVSASEKADIEAKLGALKEAIKGGRCRRHQGQTGRTAEGLLCSKRKGVQRGRGKRAGRPRTARRRTPAAPLATAATARAATMWLTPTTKKCKLVAARAGAARGAHRCAPGPGPRPLPVLKTGAP